jgi:hypothetical protein
MRRALFALFVCAPLVVADDQAEPPGPKAPNAREITVEGKLPRSSDLLVAPTKITTQEELAKNIPHKATRDAVLKKVDLKKEYLLLFAWSGSGTDELSFTASQDGSEVTFTHARGGRKDLRYHVKLYALPKKAKYKLVK